MATPTGGKRRPSKRPGVIRAKAYITKCRNVANCMTCGVSGREVFLDLHGPDHPEKPHLRIGNMCSSGYSNASIAAEIARCCETGGGWACRACHVKEDRLESVAAASRLSAALRKTAPPKKCGRCKGTTTYLSRSNMCRKCQTNANKRKVP